MRNMKKKLLILCMLALMLCPFISSFTVKAKEDAPTYTVLVLDASGKHEFYTKKYGEYKLIYTADSACDEMKAASSEFASKLLGVDENQYIAVVVCGNTAERLFGFTNDKNAIVKKIKNIRTASEAEDCDLNAGLEDAHALLSAVTDANAKKYVIQM